MRKLLKLLGNGYTDDPKVIVIDQAKRLIGLAMAAGWSGPPFDPKVLASILDIKVKPQIFDGIDAMICVEPDGQLLLQFDPTPPVTRQNFSICHDIAHTIFPDFRETTHQRVTNPRKFDPEGQVEALCDIAASEFLMPYDHFLSDVKKFGGLSLSTMEFLRERYIASREAVLRRMIACTNEIVAAVFLKLTNKPSEKDQPESIPKFRIQYSVPSDGFSVFLPKHKSVPDTSCVYLVSSAGGTYVATENWGIKDLGRVLVEATFFPYGVEDVPQAVALIKPVASPTRRK